MNIIKPSVEILTPQIDGQEILKFIEQCGRVCYKSEHRIQEGSAEKFVKNIIKRGHEAVLEHYNFTVKFTVDRGVSHEIVRHRIASYCQESTRYCNYSNDAFDNQITVILPCFFKDVNHTKVITSLINPIEESPKLNALEKAYQAWYVACCQDEQSYFDMLKEESTPQEARAVLPNSLKTEIIVTMNLREWRHFFKLRCDKAAHPQMREVAIMLLRIVQKWIPIVFDDIVVEE